MNLTSEILKAFESSYVVQHGRNHDDNLGCFMSYQGKPFVDEGKLKIFADEAAAKRELLFFVKQTFWQGEYWQRCASNVKKQSDGYEIDLSATIKILPQYGATSRFELPENKKMFKEFRDALLKEGIVTIEKIRC